MFYYRLYGFTMESDMEIFPLVKENNPDSGRPRIQVITEKSPAFFDTIRTEGKPPYEFGTELSYLENKTLKMVVEQGSRIRIFLKEGAVLQYVRTYLLGFGMSMLAMQRGMTAIHCSAAEKNGIAVLIAGESGAGKSTVTSYFLKKGYHLMADDCAVLEPTDDGVLVWPAFPYTKACRNELEKSGCPAEEAIYIDEQKDKFMIPYRGDFSTEAKRYGGFLWLAAAESGQPQAKEISGVEKFFMCSENLFLRHLLREKKYAPAIGERCLKIAAAAPMGAYVRAFSETPAEETAEAVYGFAEKLFFGERK